MSSRTALAENRPPSAFDWFGWPWQLQLVFIVVYLAIVLASWMIPVAIGWLVRREMRQVRLSSQF